MCYNDFFSVVDWQWSWAISIINVKNLLYLILAGDKQESFIILSLYDSFAHICQERIKWSLRVGGRDAPGVHLDSTFKVKRLPGAEMKGR